MQTRHTTVERLRASLARRDRWSRRPLMEDVLDGLEHGADSVLEHAYLRRVEGLHGLPRGVRQVSLAGPDRCDVPSGSRSSSSSTGVRTTPLRATGSATSSGTSPRPWPGT
ncbi:hypothetical protein E2C04_02395 [Nocardioides daphniae]|uniref:Uncharacterized protein n=1 Tax=Nocardioides daphniae TaxID=402297 RepID=A0A4P7U9Q4_9ACTN|nr:hypothetical protein E2C04_02395 [Nocardioides daphniae]